MTRAVSKRSTSPQTPRRSSVKNTTDAGATLQKVGVKEDSGGTQYGVKITDRTGIR